MLNSICNTALVRCREVIRFSEAPLYTCFEVLKKGLLVLAISDLQISPIFRGLFLSGISMFEYQKIALHELYPTARPYVKPLRSHAHLNFFHRNL